MSGHTPGPWAISETGAVYSAATGSLIPLYSGWVSEAWYDLDATDESRANGYLIAAAPELLEALKLACEIIEDLNRYANNHGGMIDDETFLDGLAAIAKAEGRS